MKIKTHNSNAQYLNNNHFFILSKGNNAGKPMHNPCPNCFVFFTSNQQEKEYYYWLCYGLWVGGLFRQHLTGSVIEFLRIGEVKQVINYGMSKIDLRRQGLLQSIEILNNLSNQQQSLIKQVQLIKQLKKAVMLKLFKSSLPNAIVK
jgi:hypothetical protein